MNKFIGVLFVLSIILFPSDIFAKTITVNDIIKQHLSAFGIQKYKVEKKIVSHLYTAVSIHETSKDFCESHGFEYNSCIMNIIISNQKIIYSNVKEVLECNKNNSCFLGDGYVDKFTENGVLFLYLSGEGNDCGGGFQYSYTYLNFHDMKKLYINYTEHYNQINPLYDCGIGDNERPKNIEPKFEKVRSYYFWDSKENKSYQEKALKIPYKIASPSKTIEKAYYDFYGHK